MTDTTERILDFIGRRFPEDIRWTDGNCYFFSLILRDVFGGRILYDSTYGHFLTEIGGELYDHRGLYQRKGGESLTEWGLLKEEDSTHWERIRRDCCT